MLPVTGESEISRDTNHATLPDPKFLVTEGRERKFFLSWYTRDDREKCTILSEHHATSNGRQ
jgi:hypothetical protein